MNICTSGPIRKSVFASIALAVFALLPRAATAATISSSSFSLGYGFTSGGWDTTETSGVNTATTIGDFSFLPAVTGGSFASRGPTFTNRALADGDLDPPADRDHSASNLTFTNTITGSWSGTIPPNNTVSLRLNIDQISVYARGHSGFGSGGLAFPETTVGHLATSPEVALTYTSIENEASYFTQLSWNPGDFEVAETNSVTGTFVLVGDNHKVLDGFEIQGTIDGILTPIPEPGTLALLGLGAMGIGDPPQKSRWCSGLTGSSARQAAQG